MKTVFSKKKITSSNVQSYMAEMYPNLSNKNIKNKVISSVPALLQKNYGGANDCTLTSLTAILMRLTRETNANIIYNRVERTAKVYGYTGSSGTNPLLIKKIFDDLLESLSVKKITKARYLKECGYSFNLIKQLVDAGTAIILSMYSDGRGYYENHSVLIVGYSEYKLSNNKIKRFLIVQDNWNKDKCFIDYDKLSIISSINY